MFALEIIGFLMFLFVILGYWQRRMDRQAKSQTVSQLQEAVHRGSHQPLTQYPQINPYSCIGCGSCIEACPEDGVIGLVNGIAQIVNGARCVGHAHCEYACPVGAIKVGLGNTALRPDIPQLTASLESSIPNVFIAGELGGISLIRNAITQGAQVMDTVTQRLRSLPAAPAGVADVAIIGAGPAGLSATMRAIENRLSYATISQEEVGGAVRKYPRRKLTLIQTVTMPLGGRLKGGEYEKEQLVALWDDLIRAHQVKIHTGVHLVGLQRRGDILVVTTSAGTVQARAVVLALGRRGTPRKLGVPGEDSGKVMYQLVDAASFTGQHLLIVGGGDSAIEAATGLCNQSGNTVTLSYRKENFFRLKSRNEQRIREYIDQKRLRVLFNSEVTSITPTHTHLKISDGTTLALRNDYTFVFAGGDPPYPLLKQIGIRFGGEPDTARIKETIRT